MSVKNDSTAIKLENCTNNDTLTDNCDYINPSKTIDTLITKDGGWGWIVVFASLVASMLCGGIVYSYGVLAPEFVKQFGVSRSTIGWMGSILVAITLGVGPIVSYLCERFSMRIVGVVGGFISAIGFAAPYFYRELWFVIVGSSIVCGFGFGLVYLPSIIIVNVWFEEKRSLAMGIAVCGSGLGTFVLSPLLEYLMSSFGWEWTMLITGGILLFLIPCCMTYITGTNSKIKAQASESNEINADHFTKSLSSTQGVENINIEENLNSNIQNNDVITEAKKSFKEIITNPIFILFIVSNILSSIGFNAPYMFAKDRAILAGLTNGQGSFLISSIGIGNCIGRVGFGYLATFKCVNRFHLFNSALILSGLMLIISWIMNTYILMLVYTILFGLFSGAFISLISIVMVDMFGIINLNKAFGIILVFQGVSVLIGPPFAGWIFDLTESFNIVFTVCGLCISISGLIMYLAYLSNDFKNLKFQN